MILPEEIVEMLRKKSGLKLQTPADSKLLIDTIYEETKEMLGLSTMKRLLGIFADTRSPRRVTLNIIARYLGYSDWEMLLLEKCGGDSDFDPSLQHIGVPALIPGTSLRIEYHPDRILELLYKGNFIFEITNYTGTKLQIGDQLEIYEIIRTFPLYIKDVIRKGNSLGSYVTARRNGIQKVSLFAPPKK